MYYFLFDTETTGLGSKDEVIQFSGLLLRDPVAEDGQSSSSTNLVLMKFYNFYCNTTQVISDGAYQVHGIDKNALVQLSEGKTFEDNFYPFLTSLRKTIEADKTFNGNDVCWVAYNVAFDKRLVNQTLVQNGLPAFNFGKNNALFSKTNGDSNVCLMNAITSLLGKRRKLSEVIAYFDLESQINKSFKVFADKCGIGDDISYHNAAYDVFASFVVMNHCIAKLRC